MVNNSTNINKTTITSHLKPLNTKKTMTYRFGNPSSGLRQAHKCGRVKLVNGIPSQIVENYL
jgi:hypothetical protein